MKENLSFETNNNKDKSEVVKEKLKENKCDGCNVLEKAFLALKRFKQNI